MTPASTSIPFLVANPDRGAIRRKAFGYRYRQTGANQLAFHGL
jgi:hypothetical protein